ncbi:cohesin domain-containing protein [Candidatus Zixiibacteriota bacterium]
MLSLALVTSALAVVSCDVVIPELPETELENPIDPETPETYVAPETTIVSGPEDGSTISTSTTTITFDSNADLYQWNLRGTDWNSAGWSDWSATTSATLEYLNEGEYDFLVRSAYDPGEGEPTAIDTSAAVVTFFVDAIAGPALRMSPLLIEPETGVGFEIEIIAEEVTDLMAVKAVISFDPSLMTVEGIQEGDFLTSTGGSLASYFDVDTDAGTIEINIGTAAGSPVGVTGTGTVATLQCLVTSTTDQVLEFDQALTVLRDADNQPITITSLVAARVRVQ